MNFDKISFRPTAEEKAFLEKANQKYRCRTITNLMHKLLAEFISKSVNMVPTWLESQSQNLTEDKLVMKDTRLEFISPTNQNVIFPERQPIPKDVEPVNPYLEMLQDIFWFEEARQKLERIRSFR